MMVSNAESNEDTWNFRQKQLSVSRNGVRKPSNNKKTYESIHSNRKPNAKSTKNPTNNNSYARSNQIAEQDFDRSINKSRTIVIPGKTINNNSQSYTPLSTPHQYRNNTSADPFGINPLPVIRSPYVSSREPNLIPDLESWGIRNTSFYNTEPFYISRNSPYLPTYTSLTKPKKPYIVVPTLNRPLISNVNSYDLNPRLDYISVIPYRHEFDYPQLNHTDNQSLRSDEYIKNAQQVLKNFEAKDYDGKELFSTKFLEDLDYKAKIAPVKPVKKKSLSVRKDPIAEDYIQSVKAQAFREIPEVDYSNLGEEREKKREPRYDKYAIDLAEKLYQTEIDNLMRQEAENAIHKERSFKQAFEKPIYDTVLEPTIREMIEQIASGVIIDHQKNIQYLQDREIKKVAKENIVNNLMLDHMLDTVTQHGKVVAENDDVANLLDGMLLEVLLGTHSDVRKVREKTVKNYPLKKFHLNSFMNVALDILVAELSSSLEEDMKDLDEIERKK